MNVYKAGSSEFPSTSICD